MCTTRVVSASTSVSPSDCILISANLNANVSTRAMHPNGQLARRCLELHYFWPVSQCVKSASLITSVRVLRVSGPSLLQTCQPVWRPTPQFLPRAVFRQVYHTRLMLSCETVCWQALLRSLRPPPRPLPPPEVSKRFEHPLL